LRDTVRWGTGSINRLSGKSCPFLLSAGGHATRNDELPIIRESALASERVLRRYPLPLRRETVLGLACVTRLSKMSARPPSRKGISSSGRVNRLDPESI